MNIKLIQLPLLAIAILSLGSVSQAYPKNNTPVTFVPPKGGKPVASVGGATRGEQCFPHAEATQPGLKSLMPADYQGLTVAARPTLFVNLPPTTAQEAFFSLQDEQGEQLYQEIMPLPAEPGILRLQLPETAPALEIGKSYKWHFVVMCNNVLNPDSPLAEGYMQRIAPEPSLVSQLESSSALEQAALYGQAGIWHETVSSLAQLKQAQPHDSAIAANWEALLTTVGLENFANQPLIK